MPRVSKRTLVQNLLGVAWFSRQVLGFGLVTQLSRPHSASIPADFAPTDQEFTSNQTGTVSQNKKHKKPSGIRGVRCEKCRSTPYPNAIARRSRREPLELARGPPVPRCSLPVIAPNRLQKFTRACAHKEQVARTMVPAALPYLWVWHVDPVVPKLLPVPIREWHFKLCSSWAIVSLRDRLLPSGVAGVPTQEHKQTRPGIFDGERRW